MRIIWFTWKDKGHPLHGGAETVTDAICSRLAKDGHTVTLLTSLYDGATKKDHINGYEVIRVGGRYSVYWHAYRYYRKHLVGNHDLIIEEINTIPFFTKFYTRHSASSRSFLFFHQLAREIWFYQMPFPVSLVGYLLEPCYLRLARLSSVITISESTKRDLVRHGYKSARISVISEGIEIAPAPSLEVAKADVPTILSLGAFRHMKRTLDIVHAFEHLKSRVKNAKLVLAGETSGAYGARVMRAITASKYAKDIHVLGKVNTKEKIYLLRAAHVLLVTSLKEGWGLIVTEANSQGTPAVVYNVDGLRDSVKDGRTGLITQENTPQALADRTFELLSNDALYARIRKAAYEWSKTITFLQQYEDFKAATGIKTQIQRDFIIT